VHHPLAFLSTAYTLDALYGLTQTYRTVRALAAVAPWLPQIAQFAYFSHALGVLTAVPSMTSGTAEFWELYRKGGINQEDKKRTNPCKSGDEVVDSSIKIGAVHGVLNAVAFGVSGYAVWTRFRTPNFAPGRTSLILSVLTLPGVAISAALGGELVYGKGIGVQRMGPAKDVKEAGMKEQSSIKQAL
jgi:uncharacterized membrane protein